MSHLTALNSLAGLLLARLAASRDERGAFTTETVIVTAVLAALAIGATALIVSAVMSKAASIPTE